MSFKVGQKVICIVGGWLSGDGLEKTTGPEKDKIYIVSGLNIGYTVKGTTPCISVEEFPGDFFEASCFRAIDYDFAEKLLAEIAEEINEEQLVTV